MRTSAQLLFDILAHSLTRSCTRSTYRSLPPFPLSPLPSPLFLAVGRVTEHISIPGATALILHFDSRCHTEYQQDIVHFHSTEQCKTVDILYSFSGPELGNIPPVRIESDEAWLRFEADEFRSYWGYKIDVTAIFPEPTVKSAIVESKVCRVRVRLRVRLRLRVRVRARARVRVRVRVIVTSKCGRVTT